MASDRGVEPKCEVSLVSGKRSLLSAASLLGGNRINQSGTAESASIFKPFFACRRFKNKVCPVLKRIAQKGRTPCSGNHVPHIAAIIV